jgi:hypothetical protein
MCGSNGHGSETLFFQCITKLKKQRRVEIITWELERVTEAAGRPASAVSALLF